MATTAEALPAAYGDPRLPRWHPATLFAGWWAVRSLRATRRAVERSGLAVVVPPPSRRLPRGATRGVLGVIRRRPNTCLERSLVLQRWLSAHGEPYDVIVGVANDGGLTAHAWLPFEAGRSTSTFVEITRVVARAD